MGHDIEILLITGPAGVGKSTLSWEIGRRLEESGTAHAIVESDELDRVYPKPTAEQLERLLPGCRDVSAVNLAALWSTYHALGHTKLVMSGVMLHPQFDRRWILQAIPDASITVVRLLASDEVLTERVTRREIGSGATEQLQRTLRQAHRMAGEEASDTIRIRTDGHTPIELAEVVLRQVGWLAPATAEPS